MKNKSLKDLLQLKSRELPAILLNWKEYDQQTVLITYLDCTRRQMEFTDEISTSLNEFSTFHNKSLNQMAEEFFNENSVENYNQYFDKITNPVLTEEQKSLKEFRRIQIDKAYEKERRGGTKDIVIGGIVLVVGTVITLATLSSGSGLITYGAILFGVVKIAQGLYKYNM
ncbi:hypothetical protein [Moheibacter sediminis]|uniref:Uncharacterized protein n=1 Tax=Moheibacter sediminis TaxID=1434700 RepID=A0A1W2AYH2_9FLAO|nr:hypothetical protein [Moheibacter sediminis]SMC65590.1 hypothetical protein SAMN06296427_105132 [Moheibacter sediminis]